MKRAQGETSFLVSITLVVIVIVVLIGLYIALRQEMFASLDDTDCAAQIQAQAVIVGATNELSAPGVKCPTKQVSAKGQEEAQRVIADQMKRCWNMWGRGELQLFGEKEGAYCHLCSMVSITGTPAVYGLPEYLHTHKATKSQMYDEYLMGKTQGSYFADASFKPIAQSSLPTSKPVAVIFYYAKGNEAYKRLWNSIATPASGSVAGGTLGGAVGAGAVTAVGLGGPIAWGITAVSAAAGTATGFVAGMYGRATNSYMTFVVVRPLDAADIKDLGCQYDMT